MYVVHLSRNISKMGLIKHYTSSWYKCIHIMYKHIIALSDKWSNLLVLIQLHCFAQSLRMLGYLILSIFNDSRFFSARLHVGGHYSLDSINLTCCFWLPNYIGLRWCLWFLPQQQQALRLVLRLDPLPPLLLAFDLDLALDGLIIDHPLIASPDKDLVNNAPPTIHTPLVVSSKRARDDIQIADRVYI